jgi:predicted acylesterase/phospholipase RssA
MAEQARDPVAFVMSGGAAHGAIQVGMLAALYDRGVVPDMITAASAGALNGAFIASRPTTAATVRDLARLWIGLRRRVVFPTNPITGALGFFGRHDHFVSPHRLRELITGSMQFDRLEEAAIPRSPPEKPRPPPNRIRPISRTNPCATPRSAPTAEKQAGQAAANMPMTS